MRNFPYDYLFVNSDGRLYRKEPYTKKYEVTLNAYNYASIPVIFSKEATFGTLIKIIENNEYLKPLLQYADEYINESHKNNRKTLENKNYALYFMWWPLEKNEKCYTDYPKMEVDGYDLDTKQNFGIDFLATNELINFKIYIDTEYKVLDENENLIFSVTRFPTLFHVLYGLFWELSFFGKPEDRDRESMNLKNILNEIIKDKEVNQ